MHIDRQKPLFCILGCQKHVWKSLNQFGSLSQYFFMYTTCMQKWKIMKLFEESCLLRCDIITHYLLVCLPSLFFNPEDESKMFLWNVSKLLPDCMASHPMKWFSS
jgi:hypothetical protein